MNKNKKKLPLKPNIQKLSIEHEDFLTFLDEIIVASTSKKEIMRAVAFAQYNNDQDECYNAPNGQCYD